MEIKQYKGLKVGKELVDPVTNEQVEAEIQNMLAESTSFKSKEGKSELGDVCNINFEGFVDGVAFEGGKGENYDLELGSGSFIPGFEDQLVGYEVGADVDVNVTFPEEYHAENLKGKPAVFKCKINEIKTKVAAEFNDEFAAKYGMPSAEAMKKELENRMNQQNAETKMNEYLGKVYEMILSENEIEVDETKLAARLDEMLLYYGRAMQQYGQTLESYVQLIGTTLEDFKKTLVPEAEKTLKIDVVTNEVARLENLAATEEEFDGYTKGYAEYYKLSEEQLAQFKTERGEDIKTEIQRQKVANFLIKNND